MGIRVSCLSCGHLMDLGEAYEDFVGEVRCWVCRAVLEMTLCEGKLKGMRRSGGVVAPLASMAAVQVVQAPDNVVAVATDTAPQASGHESR